MQGQENEDGGLTLLTYDIDTLLSLIYGNETYDEEVRKIAEEAKMATFMLTEKVWDIYKEIQWRAEMLTLCCGKRNRDLCRGYIDALRRQLMLGDDETERRVVGNKVVVVFTAMYWAKKIRAAVGELMELLGGRDVRAHDILKTISRKLDLVEEEIRRIHDLLGALSAKVSVGLNRKNAIRFARELEAIAKSIV